MGFISTTRVSPVSSHLMLLRGKVGAVAGEYRVMVRSQQGRAHPKRT